MEGKRVFGCISPHLLLNGDYGHYEDVWYGRCPNGLLANLSKHNVVEHEDGSISVTPSIKCDNGLEVWHGYLKSGIWEEVCNGKDSH